MLSEGLANINLAILPPALQLWGGLGQFLVVVLLNNKDEANLCTEIMQGAFIQGEGKPG